MKLRVRTGYSFAAFLVLVFVLALFSCGKGKSGSSGLDSTGTVSAGNGSTGITLEEIIEEAESYPVPADIDEGIFDELMSEFTKQLESNQGRFAAAAPMGEAGKVTDLAYSPASGLLTWTYVNLGDYNLSGDVNIADVAEIARHYLHERDGEGNFPDEYDVVIDGSRDGSISIADVAPIAQNYLNRVASYEIQYSVDGGNFAMIATVEFSSSLVPPDGGFARFTYLANDAPFGFYRVVPYDSNEATYGAESNVFRHSDGSSWAYLGNLNSLGPGGGGATFSAVYHNTDPQTILVGQDMGGIFKTTDGGASWRHVNQGGITIPEVAAGIYGVPGLFADPRDDNVFYATTWSGMYRSADVGETWTRLVPEEAYDPDEGEIGFDWVAFSPDDPNLVLAGTGDWHFPEVGQGLYRSTDGGLSFALADATGIPEDASYGSIAFDPADGSVFAATSVGLYRSVNDGDSFTKVNGPFAHDHGHWIGIGGDAVSRTFWYVLNVLGDDGNVANWSGGVYTSTDGTSWTEIPNVPREMEEDDGELLRPQGARIHPDDPSVLYLNTRTFGYWGMVLRYDGSWTNMTAGWVNDTYHLDSEISPLGLAISPSAPDNIIINLDMGQVQSSDGGATWWQSFTTQNGDTWSGTGAEVTMAYDVENRNGVLYAAFEDIGLWRSEDQGQSWRLIWWYFNEVGERVDPVNDACSEIIVHPEDADRIYFTATSWSNGVREKAYAKLYYSLNGGTTNQEITPSAATAGGKASRPAIAVVWGASQEQDTVYVAFHGDTLYKSTDGGASWSEATRGMAAADRELLFCLEADPDNPSIVYAGLSTWFGEFGTTGGLYRTTDAGGNWEKLSGYSRDDVACIRFVGSPQRLFVGGWTYNEGSGFGQGSLMVSDDGTTFTPVLAQPYVFDVIDVADAPGTLLASACATYTPGDGQDAGIYISTTNGVSWTKLSGDLIYTWSFALTIMPEEPNKLFMGTGGIGVMSGVLQ